MELRLVAVDENGSQEEGRVGYRSAGDAADGRRARLAIAAPI
jgi:hypothetical protein